MDATATVDRALAHHNAGKLDEAQSLYRSILATQPNHADALHLLGMIHLQTGDHTEAQRLIRQAISIRPDQAVYHSNLGLVLAASGQATAAIEAHRTATRLDPKSAEALNNLAVALFEAGQRDDAIEALRLALVLRPDYADARRNLLQVLKVLADTAKAHHIVGDLFHEAGNPPEAVKAYRRAIELDPRSAETYNNLGTVLAGAGDRQQALACYEKALRINPSFPQACNNLANVLKQVGRYEESIAAYKRSIELQPDSPDPLSNLGNLLRDAGQWDTAMELYHRALAIRPDHVESLNNLGIGYCEKGDWKPAMEAFEQAIAIKPDYADAINNYGTALEETGQRDRAMQCYQQAKLLDPQAISPPWNIALLQLLRGDYERGWSGYEHRWLQKKQSRAKRDFTQPMPASRSELKGRRILLHAEQGFGDALQFCRYAPLVAQHGAEVILECPGELARLFSGLDGVKTIITKGQVPPAFDLHCPLMSLPMLLGTTLATVPADVPYLWPDQADVEKWKERFAGEPKAPRVGLVWAGHSSHQKDRHRSLSLADFAALASIDNIRFYSLQVGPASQQAKSPPPGMVLIDWTADLKDFADTAALVSQLDLVITVDTAVCHLAGAMGKPVWVLLAYQPDWRWLLDRQDSPWYPTARLFRQPALEQWNVPLDAVRSELKKWNRSL